MKKKAILFTLVSIMLFGIAGTCLAAPLKNFDQGHVSVDLEMSISPDFGELDGKNRFNGGITAGLGNNLALQYKYSDNRSEELFMTRPIVGFIEGQGTANAKLNAHEVNLLYKITPNVTAFAGVSRAKAEMNIGAKIIDTSNNSVLSVEDLQDDSSKTSFQVGVLGEIELMKGLDAWTSIAVGSKKLGYEIGIGYAITENVDFNLFYRDVKYKDFQLLDQDLDIKVKGVGTGLTVKF